MAANVDGVGATERIVFLEILLVLRALTNMLPMLDLVMMRGLFALPIENFVAWFD